MRVAALFDIHGNLSALDAVLSEVRASGADQVVVGGDVVPGPFPRETLARLFALEWPVSFIHGNCELSILAQIEALDGGPVRYWGTVSGNPLPAVDQEVMRWTANLVKEDFAPRFAAWPRTTRLEIQGIGAALFCHGTPRSETEVFTRLTSEAKLLPLFEGLGADLVVCGHTHMQFDRQIGRTRVVNAGSVGMPFGSHGAYWALLGPGVELRRTEYDVEATASRIRATDYPLAEQDAAALTHPAGEAEVLQLFGGAELR